MTDRNDEMLLRLVLGRYRIVRLLAKGGMGAVYLARVEGAAGFAKPVVVKRILPHLNDSADDRAQFIREARILSQLRHPGIVNVVDFGQQDGAYLMVLDYVHGFHLGQWLKYVVRARQQMPWQVCACIMLQVLAALQYAHTYRDASGERNGVVHRDISPSNILLDIDGNVRIVDFGVARAETEQTIHDGPERSVFQGKLPYGAPELFSGEKATPSTDIYACAVILYQLLTGTNPFSAAEPGVIIRRVLTLVPPAIDTLREDVPRELGPLLAKALHKEATERFASAKDFAASLRGLLQKPEADILSEMAATLRADFTGQLPEILKLPPLNELDSAWRNARSVSGTNFTPSIAITIRPGRAAIAQRGVGTTDAAATNEGAATAAKAVPSSRRLVFVATAAAAGAAAAAVAVVLAMRASVPRSEPKYLVVESGSYQTEVKRDDAQAESNDDASSAPQPASSTTPSSAQDTRVNAPPSRVDAKPRDPSTALSRTFAKRQGAMQKCFQTHAANVSGAPEVSVRFSIDTNGTVTAATVSPAAIGATALGQCLAQVARSTSFGPQSQPMVFVIPVTTTRAR